VKLKCCPFCGSHKVEIARTNGSACWVVCDRETGCGAASESHADRKRAIENWNRRHYDDEPATIVYDQEKD